MCNIENHSVAAEIKTEQMDEYPEFPNFSDFNSQSEICSSFTIHPFPRYVKLLSIQCFPIHKQKLVASPNKS